MSKMIEVYMMLAGQKLGKEDREMMDASVVGVMMRWVTFAGYWSVLVSVKSNCVNCRLER